MMALTYQQDPKKYNPTIRLKRISQRFSPGFKQIRMFKEDYLGHLASRIAYKRNQQLDKKPFFGYKLPYVRPGRKWRIFIPKARKRKGLITHENVSQRFVAMKYKSGCSTLFAGTTARKIQQEKEDAIFLLADARRKQLIINKQPNLFKLFAICYKQFHCPFHILGQDQRLAGHRFRYTQQIIRQEIQIKKKITREQNNLKKLQRKLIAGFRHPNPARNNKEIENQKRDACLAELRNSRKILRELALELDTFVEQNKFKDGIEITQTQTPIFKYGVIPRTKNILHTNKMFRFPQNHLTAKRHFKETKATYMLKLKYKEKHKNFYQLNRRKAVSFIRQRANILLKKKNLNIPQTFFNALEQNKIFSITNHRNHKRFLLRKLKGMQQKTTRYYKEMAKEYAKLKINKPNTQLNFFERFFGPLRQKKYTLKPFNIFNFNTKSNQVLYRYMQILKEKFGVYYVDIPFRIDNYRKAYQKKRRPTKYKRMCIARAKMRLFYGQLTVEKMGRVLRKGKASFPYMFGLMERRLDVLLVRANFCKNIFTAQHIVKAGHILVNNKIQRNCFYAIKQYDYVTFKSKKFEQYCKYLILTKLRLNRFKQPLLPYLVINYKLMYLYVRPLYNARKQVGFTAPLTHSFLSKY